MATITPRSSGVNGGGEQLRWPDEVMCSIRTWERTYPLMWMSIKGNPTPRQGIHFTFGTTYLEGRLRWDLFPRL
nr:hypothetical protein CFP56_10574 [Quercus suber]